MGWADGARRIGVRLAAMPPQEIVHRLVLAGRARADAAGAWRSSVRPLPEGLVDRPLPDLGVRPHPGALSEPWRRSLAADTEALLRGRFVLLGVERDAAQRCEWALDPVTGARWGDAPGADIKRVWELSRLQHLQVLAWAAAMGDIDAGRAVRSDLIDWHLANPPYRGFAWTDGLEAASRVASLLAIATLLPALSDDDALRRVLWESLALHGARIARYPSRWSAANNHAVGELSALVVLGHAAPDLPDAAAWRDLAGDLVAVARRQQHDDGVGAEQSPTYHAYTLEWLLLARQVVARGGGRLPIDDLLRRGADALAEWCADAPAPRIGDDDEGVVLRQGLAPDDRVRSVAAAIAGALGDAAVSPTVVDPDPRAALLGVSVAPGPARAASRLFPEGGYTVLRGALGARPARVIVDHGPLGFEDTAGHGHADALSVWLDVGGRPVVVDFGTYAYGADPAWRAWARSTAAHPTVTVDGRGQATGVGSFSWRGRPRARLVRAALAEGLVVAENDAWEGGLSAVHRRTVRFGPTVRVEDVVEAAGAHEVAARWTFARDLDVVAVDGVWHVRDGADTLATVRFEGEGWDVRAHAGRGVSPRWGAIAPATTLEVVRRGPSPARLVTVFGPGDAWLPRP